MSETRDNTMREFLPVLRSADWMDRANCRPPVDADRSYYELIDRIIFDEPRRATEDEVERICGGCPVRKQCLAFGMATGSQGRWGMELLPRRAARPQPAAA